MTITKGGFFEASTNLRHIRPGCAKLLLEKGYEVYGTSRDAQMTTFGNLDRLGIRCSVRFESMAINYFRSVLQVTSKVHPDEIYYLAGQSSVGLSFEQPVETLESITVGTLNILEVLRFLNLPVRFYNAGSSEWAIPAAVAQMKQRRSLREVHMPMQNRPLSGKSPTTGKRTGFMNDPGCSSITNPHFVLNVS
jgi:GDP-D-mannose dehydratase